VVGGENRIGQKQRLVIEKTTKYELESTTEVHHGKLSATVRSREVRMAYGIKTVTIRQRDIKEDAAADRRA
jgi:hypothetical protein